ncbi:efflux RND transporter periplasmic adaptor subunit [Luteimonas sp. MC1895]|uniref:efflux RND transporter periplasmic adaptor subunit n=1 Tax=Luteimonas sp. MC1895 TaxID=2819513 RepID=UPI001F25A70E|nr:efflux RND transporter periplasmic adaptor subunit [Luteimonas sp. MC1895]
MSGMRRIRWAVPGAIALVLAACGDGTVPEPPPRAVLVAQPQPGSALARSFPGEIRARAETPLGFRVGGELVRRLVDVGDRVARGQLLAVIDPADFEAQARAASARLAAAEAQLTRAAADRARYATLARDQLVSRSALDAQDAAWRAADGEVRAARAQAEVAGNQASHAELRAPADGVIASRQAEAGQVVAGGQAVFTLAGDDGREVAIALPESAVGDFSVGQPVEVELWSAPGERLRGRFREISPAADPVARTYAARVALEEADAARVALGQSAKVHVTGAGAALSVPLSAIQADRDGSASVWVFDQGRVRAARVETGRLGAERAPVTSGLAADDWVVVAGGHLLREGQDVRAVDLRNRPVAASR